MNHLSSSPVNTLKGTINVPGDKSISQRCLILGALSIGTTEIKGISESEDVNNLIKNLKKLGVNILKKKDVVKIHGVGIGGFEKPKNILDMGNSGTATRLLLGALANQSFKVTVTGDKSLKDRPMKRIITPLNKMGIEIKSKNNMLPIQINGLNETLPITYEMPMPSAQVKSCILLSSLSSPGKTTIIEKISTRDHTEILLKLFGAGIKTKKENNKSIIEILGQKELVGRKINISADPSSAAIIGSGGLLTNKSEIKIKNVNMNKTRSTFFKILKKMKANIYFSNKKIVDNENVADITFKSSNLSAINLKKSIVTQMIDEIPIFCILASFANGVSTFTGGEELKYKESNRLETIYNGLKACRIKVIKKKDGLKIFGSQKPVGGCLIKTKFDHRIAMSFLIMGLNSQKKIIVDKPNCINTSFPKFKYLLNTLGGKIK